jgi:Fe-S-cluster-containing dehydrogenase component
MTEAFGELSERRWGMVIDLDRCTGCGACVAACKSENNVPEVDRADALAGRVMNWMRVAHAESEERHGPSATYPMLCYHCDDPPCTRVCPVHATYVGIDGIVGQTYSRCIGCRYCMSACPYTVKVFNWHQPQWEEELRDHTNPDVSMRPMGVVEKCTFCSHRLQEARDTAACENRDVDESDYQPACVEICPAKAMIFGDLLERDSRVATMSRSPRSHHFLEELGTEPSVIYLKERERRV